MTEIERERRKDGRRRRLAKYRITLSVTERKKEREIVRESEEECLCVTIY